MAPVRIGKFIPILCMILLSQASFAELNWPKPSILILKSIQLEGNDILRFGGTKVDCRHKILSDDPRETPYYFEHRAEVKLDDMERTMDVDTVHSKCSHDTRVMVDHKLTDVLTIGTGGFVKNKKGELEELDLYFSSAKEHAQNYSKSIRTFSGTHHFDCVRILSFPLISDVIGQTYECQTRATDPELQGKIRFNFAPYAD
jgi:hypothetical protein